MRAALLILLILLVALAGFLLVTSRGESAPQPLAGVAARLPLGITGAEELIVVPRAGAVLRTLSIHPITRDQYARWVDSLGVPVSPFLIGSGDVVLWREEGRMRFLLRLDPVRRVLVQVAARLSGRPLESHGGLLTDGAPGAEAEAVALPPAADGEAFIVHLRARDFPPVDAPAVTSIVFHDAEISAVSRGGPASTPRSLVPMALPMDATLSLWIDECPERLARLSLVGGDFCAGFEQGGMVSIYEAATQGIIPFRGVVTVPADAVAGPVNEGGRMLRVGDLLVVGDSRSTAERFATSRRTEVSARVAAPEWVARFRPRELMEVLDSPAAATILLPSSVRRTLDRWRRVMEQADVVEASAGVESGRQEVRVRIMRSEK